MKYFRCSFHISYSILRLSWVENLIYNNWRYGIIKWIFMEIFLCMKYFISGFKYTSRMLNANRRSVYLCQYSQWKSRGLYVICVWTKECSIFITIWCSSIIRTFMITFCEVGNAHTFWNLKVYGWLVKSGWNWFTVV